MLTPAVLSSKPTLKVWHAPTRQLQESHVHAFRMCHVHIKCVTENSLWMTDKLDRMLKSFIGLNKVRTIYNSGNQSALIPTTERCSLHYLLQSNNSKWEETYDYMNYRIQDFVVRRTFQTALIHVMEGSPLSLPVNAQDEAFQWTDGHHFFLDVCSGWLYFRNVRGDWNVWERSRDHEGLISSKMKGKWSIKESKAKVAIFIPHIQNFLSWLNSVDTRRCAFLRVQGEKDTFMCTKEIMMAEAAADVLNFTTVYTNDWVNRSEYPTGVISYVFSTDLVLDSNRPENVARSIFTLIFVFPPKFVYCSYNTRARSMSIAVWFFPFDLISWIVVLGILCLFWLLQVISSGSHYSSQSINDSILVIFRILFRQALSKPKRLSMFFVVFFLIFSMFYENLITSSLIAPTGEMPFDNITEAISAGYVSRSSDNSIEKLVLFFTNHQSGEMIRFIDKEMYPNENKYIYMFSAASHNDVIYRIVKEIKHPYQCLQTKERSEFVLAFLESRTGMNTQLAPVFEWIQEAGLFSPFFQLESAFSEFRIRSIQYELKNSKGKEASYVEVNLITLLNLVPLYIASTITFIIACFIFLSECEKQKWRSDCLALKQMILAKVDFIRSLVSLIIGHIESECNKLLSYCSDKIQRIRIRKSVKPIIWVESNS
jgi:hypothetical protein